LGLVHSAKSQQMQLPSSNSEQSPKLHPGGSEQPDPGPHWGSGMPQSSPSGAHRAEAAKAGTPIEVRIGVDQTIAVPAPILLSIRRREIFWSRTSSSTPRHLRCRSGASKRMSASGEAKACAPCG